MGQWYNWCPIVHLQFVYNRQRKNKGSTLSFMVDLGRVLEIQISEIISYCDDASFKSTFLPQYWPAVLLNEYHLLS